MPFRQQTRGFPIWQMSVVAAMRFSEPLSFTSLFPYVYFMIRDFHVTDDLSQISRYTGLLAASFAFTQFLFCIHWGRLSDRIGRKPVLLTGLCGSGVSLLVFGFSKNFYTALAARSAAGALNGNIAVLQTLVGEIATDRRHQGLAFAALPLLWQVGCVIGPLIGGSKYLTRPAPDPSRTDGSLAAAMESVSVSSYDDFLNKHPYAMSNVVVASILFTSAVIGFLFLEETHARVKKKYDVGLVIGDAIRRRLGFEIPVRPWEKKKTAAESGTADGTQSPATLPQADSAILPDIDEIIDSDDETTPLNADPVPIYASSIASSEPDGSDDGLDLTAGILTRRSSLAVIRRYSSNYSLQPTFSVTTMEGDVEPQVSLWAALRNREIFSYKVLGTMLAYFTLVFHALLYSEFVPIYLAGAFKKDKLQFPWHIQGGMGWETQVIGSLLSYVGLVGCCMVMFVFPFLDRHVKTIYGFRAACLVFPIAYFLLPYIIFTTPQYNPSLPPSLHRLLLYANSMFAVVGSSLAFPQVVILVYRATKPQYRGLVNSTTMSANSLARFVAPVMWGALTSYFDVREMAQVPWNILALLALLSVVLAFTIDEYSEDLEPGESSEV